MSRTGASFERRGKLYREQPTVLLLCEDSKSSVEYLSDAAQHFRAHAKVVISHCGRTDPLGIVNEAKRNLQKFDKVFCVIDRDDHLSFDEAFREAATSEQVRIIDSHPCYEYWLLLHASQSTRQFRAVGAKSAADQLISELRQEPLFKNYSKSGSKGLFEALLQKLADAEARSKRIRQQAEEDGDLNPSTLMHCLISELRSLGTVIKI